MCERCRRAGRGDSVVRRFTKSSAMYSTMTIVCDEALRDRVSSIAERDGVSRSHALRALGEFALPHFEGLDGSQVSGRSNTPASAEVSREGL